ncbi:MAG: hypothetical protein MI924_07605 [Chloroflexales bacterium]|nr:hypothetical protein [Chloroflexales bacterium]
MLNPRLDGTLVDLGWSFNAARDLIAQRDPYRHPVSANLVPYPLTAAIIVAPWAILPGNIGLILLFGLATGLLAYGVLHDNQYWRLILFATPSYLMAVKSMQWSPLFMAVLFFPALAPILLAKPTLGFPVACSIRWTIPRLLGIVLIGGVSLLIMPNWPIRWIAQTGDYDGLIPLLSPLGPVFLCSLFFWRNAQARFFFLLTITPQHRLFYDQLLLWMIPQTKRQMLLLIITSWIAFFYVRQKFTTFWASGPYLLTLVYLPAFLIVLWQQQSVQRFYHRYIPRRKQPDSGPS